MAEHLTGDELVALLRRVFLPTAADKALAVLVDVPDDASPDVPGWAARRRLAEAWVAELKRLRAHHHLDVRLVACRATGANNAPLPEVGHVLQGTRVPDHADALPADGAQPFERLFATTPLWLAPTQFSMTAPLKLAAARHPLRGATMPGFSTAMIPALRLDYEVIRRRVERLKGWLDLAESATLDLEADGHPHRLVLDLTHRHGHASTGCFPSPGMVGNLPSGEAYIVPYEGESDAKPSRSEGELPVQLGDEVVVYTIRANRAVAVAGEGPQARREAELIVREPGYANLAELGLGVLSELGVAPIGELLLDEKLGLHVAFGRSDHFGGATGPSCFSSPEKAVHLDRVYLPQTQPRVRVAAVDLHLDDGKGTIALMRDGRYAVSLD